MPPVDILNLVKYLTSAMCKSPSSSTGESLEKEGNSWNNEEGTVVTYCLASDRVARAKIASAFLPTWNSGFQRPGPGSV